jgi:glutathione S-transferase
MLRGTAMKLYGTLLSNYSSKVRLVVYEKNAPVEIVSVDPGSPDYRRLYPSGKIPLLEVEGLLIGESEVINEYLEERYPEPALLPGDAEERARARGIARFHDLYLEPALRALYPQATGTEARNPERIADGLATLRPYLDRLEATLVSPFAAGRHFTLADCALVPTMTFASAMFRQFGVPAPFEGRPKLAAWWAACRERSSVQRVLGEMRQALAVMPRG